MGVLVYQNLTSVTRFMLSTHSQSSAHNSPRGFQSHSIPQRTEERLAKVAACIKPWAEPLSGQGKRKSVFGSLCDSPSSIRLEHSRCSHRVFGIWEFSRHFTLDTLKYPARVNLSERPFSRPCSLLHWLCAHPHPTPDFCFYRHSSNRIFSKRENLLAVLGEQKNVAHP
jgi:hypothetical protein